MLLAVSICVATIAGVLAIYLAARSAMRPKTDADTNDLAGSILFRIAALHGLVLALVFAAEVAEYQQIEFEVATEANAVSDLFYDMDRYGAGESASTVAASLRSYLDLATGAEWSRLGEELSLLDAAWEEWGNVYAAVLDLEPVNGRQEALRDNMLANIGIVAEKRDLREFHAQSGLGYLFWSAAVLGVAMVAAGYFIYPPSKDTIILLSMFATYTGFILFTITAMSNPFSEPAAIQPTLLLDLSVELNAIGAAQ